MKKNVIITLKDGEEKKMPSMVETLKKKGLEVQNAFEFGVITGAIEEKKMKTISKMNGILSISEDQEVSLPPSDSPLQ